MGVEITCGPDAFQADDEGSIPFTRSNLANDLAMLADARVGAAYLRLVTNRGNRSWSGARVVARTSILRWREQRVRRARA